MSITSEQLIGLRDQAEAILKENRFLNFVAQSHSRDILRLLRVAEEDWPAYTETLDEDLLYTAQTLMYVGLQLTIGLPEDKHGTAYLVQGAEILEFVYSRSKDDDPERICQLFSAALAYYICGHFARAYVLVRDIEESADLPRFLRPLRHLLLKDFRLLRGSVLDQLFRDEYRDAVIAEQVSNGALDEDQALCRVLEATMYRALSFTLEYARSGDELLIANAIKLVETGTEVAKDHKFADWWWYYSCLRVFLSTLQRHSLWTNLQLFINEESAAPLARRYVYANLRLSIPIIEFWPSQITAIPHIFSTGQTNNLCIRMPTSSGKTKIAELAILAFAADKSFSDQHKCVYVAPFRSLAVEVEHTLRRALLPLGLRVSELYGGYDMTAADRLVVENTNILVATPEKLDAFLRLNPDLARQIKLVILDEGHIVSPPKDFQSLQKARGLKYEVFLQRLIARCEKTNARIVFLSAVMPNAAQFSEWITGDAENLVSSDWRPSRLMLGEAVWTGSSVDLDYTHADREILRHKCFVKGFVSQYSSQDIPTRRRKPFPKNRDEALALTALELAQQKLTMVFVSKKNSAEHMGDEILQTLLLKQQIMEGRRDSFHLPRDPRYTKEIDRSIELIREYLGGESKHIAFLRHGFAVHHSGLPQPVRLSLERLIRSGAIRLVVATTTLAQGVNFPIHTVLIHSLHHDQDVSVSPMDFWNICGRAGRGMKENEGQILFFVQHHFEEWQKSKTKNFKSYSRSWQKKKWEQWCFIQRELRLSYIQQYGTFEVESGLLSLLKRVQELWEEKHASVDMGDFCDALANNKLDMFSTSEFVDLESLFSTLDGLLIAITEECDSDDITPETFQTLFCRSLLHLQLANPSEQERANQIFSARVEYIHKRIPNRSQRRRFYELGLPLRDCEKIEDEKEFLLEHYLKAVNYKQWTAVERSEHIEEIAKFLFHLNEIAPTVRNPDCWPRILQLWLTSFTPTEILHDDEVREENLTAYDLNHWLDEVFSYRLPWGLNSLAVFLHQCESESAEDNWPVVCDYYSSLVKYGVHEPAVCWLIALGVSSRTLANRAGELIKHKVHNPEEVLTWLRGGGIDILIAEGLHEDDAEALRIAVFGTSAANASQSSKNMRLKLTLKEVVDPAPVEGERVLLQSDSGKTDQYELVRLDGTLIHRFSLESKDLAVLMDNPEYVSVEILSSEKIQGKHFLMINVQELK